MTPPGHRARVTVVVALGTVTVALLIASVTLSPLSDASGVARVLLAIVFVALMALLPIVGGVVLVRRPGNTVGRILVATGPSWALLLATSSAAQRFLDTGDPLPGQQVWNWLEGWSGFISFNALLPLLMLVFPTGRLLTRRWIGAVGVVMVGFLSGAVGSMFAPGGLSDFPKIDNPLGVGGTFGRVCLALRDNFAWLVFAVEVVLALICVVLRFRRADEAERAQLKWMVFAASLWTLVFPAWIVAPGSLGQPVTELAVLALPVATGISVLRYRLYDIDRIISRTITYALLTAIVAGVFVGVVALVTRLTPVSSQAGVASATLLCAAAVNPFRKRLQRLVDRRFNRAPVDAVRTVDAFARAVNDEVDLDAVQSRLLTTVSSAVQPVSVSLWTVS